MNLYGFVGNDGVNGWDYLGLRELTNEEASFIQKLEELKADAGNDENFIKAVDSVITDYKSRIHAIPDNAFDPARIKYINNAFRIWASERAPLFHPSGNLDSEFGLGANKCNRYISEVIENSARITVEGGFRQYLSNDFSAYVHRMPIAGEWANPLLLREFKPKYRIVRVQLCGGADSYQVDRTSRSILEINAPVIGDIVSFGSPTSRGSGAHVGMFLGGDPNTPFYISATSIQVHGQQGVVISFGPENREKLYRSTCDE